MQQHLFWVVFVAYFAFFNKCETRQKQPENGIPYILSQLFENKNKPPIILYLEPQQDVRTIEEIPRKVERTQYGVEREEDDSYENVLRTTQTDERAYVLYHLLRTAIEDEDSDPEAVQNWQSTKEFLRNGFIGRCRQLNKCRKQCPKPKPKQACTMQCKQIFDDLDECDQPKEEKCREPKCGNTMPPSWLL